MSWKRALRAPINSEARGNGGKGSPEFCSDHTLTGGIDQFLSRTDASGTVAPIRDGLGSTIGLVDAAGTVQTQYSYEPFGKTTSSGAASGNAQNYTGREDDGTGLYYYRARYYSTTLHRFISEDPIGLRGGSNLYSYVRNNPIGFRDPSGLQDDGRDWSRDPAVGPYLAPPLGGRACSASLLRFGRAPDYYAFNGRLGVGSIPGGAAGQFIIDRYGNAYAAPGPGFVGTAGPGCSVTVGWLLQLDKPTQKQLRDFLSQHGVSIGYGNVVGANLVWGGGKTFGVEYGVFSPGWAITWQYDLKSPQNSYGPDFYWDPEARVKDRM